MEDQTMLVEVYPLRVIIRPKNMNHRQVIRAFSAKYMRVDKYFDRRTNRVITNNVSGYVFFTKDRREIRFLRTMLDDFLAVLQLNGFVKDVDYRIIEKTIDVPLDGHYPRIKEGWNPRGEQQDVIDFCLGIGKGASMLYLGTGGGKMQENGTKVSTPDGWVNIEDVKVGDTIHDELGGTTEVIGVHPQGKVPIYRVHFRDGRYADVGKEHLWEVIDCRQRRSVRTTGQIMEYLGEGGYKGWADKVSRNKRLYLPLTKPVYYPEKQYDIHPYLLGVLLGDGSLATSTVTITTPDEYIANRIHELAPDGVIVRKAKDYYDTVSERQKCPHYRLIGVKDGCRSDMQDLLANLGLKGTHSHTKFIPEAYMYGSVEQRLELVRGLIDTGGYVNEQGSISFTTTSEKMANQVRTLIHSLGGMAKISKLQKYFRSSTGEKKAGKPSYNVNIRHPKPSLLTSLPKKKARCNDLNQYAEFMKLQIMRVEYLHEAEATCISVSNPSHLYLMDDYIVTHNTITSMFIIEKMKQRFVGVMRPQFIGKENKETKALDSGWLKDFDKSYDIDMRKEACTVQGSTQLQSIINICLEKGYNPYKALLFSNKTLANYVKAYEDFSPEEFRELGYNCTPDDLPKLLGVDAFVFDEAHFDHQANCRFACYFGLNYMFGATATPNADDKHVDWINKLLYPVERRYTQKTLKVFRQPISWHYNLERPHVVRSSGFKGYSHVKFEQSILKRVRLTENYFEMVVTAYEKYHLPKLEIKPFRCLITVATIEMAHRLRDYLRGIYPKLKIESYVAGEPVTNLYTSDICVSTTLGSGTGHDIPDLATVIMTNALGSSQPNEQSIGRLRELPEPVEHSFVYFTCDDIQAHKKYDFMKRTKTFKGKCHPVRDDYTGIIV